MLTLPDDSYISQISGTGILRARFWRSDGKIHEQECNCKPFSCQVPFWTRRPTFVLSVSSESKGVSSFGIFKLLKSTEFAIFSDLRGLTTEALMHASTCAECRGVGYPALAQTGDKRPVAICKMGP